MRSIFDDFWELFLTFSGFGGQVGSGCEKQKKREPLYQKKLTHLGSLWEPQALIMEVGAHSDFACHSRAKTNFRPFLPPQRSTFYHRLCNKYASSVFDDFQGRPSKSAPMQNAFPGGLFEAT